MAEITAEMVNLLREATNAGVLDCKKALSDSNGDFEAAVEFLRLRMRESIRDDKPRFPCSGFETEVVVCCE